RRRAAGIESFDGIVAEVADVQHAAAVEGQSVGPAQRGPREERGGAACGIELQNSGSVIGGFEQFSDVNGIGAGDGKGQEGDQGGEQLELHWERTPFVYTVRL